MDMIMLHDAGLLIAKLGAFLVLVLAWRQSRRAVVEMEAAKAERAAVAAAETPREMPPEIARALDMPAPQPSREPADV
ncbi:MAG: hypothetical protein ACFBRM_06425 [Pikeienuella sp.]